MNQEINDEALLELLPWYLSGRLDAAERAQVEALLKRSEPARAELETLQGLATAVRAEELERNQHNPVPTELGWARLQRSLAQSAPAAKPARDWWRPSLAAAAALILALQVGILSRPASVESDWQLQSGGAVQQLTGGYRVQLRFVDHAQWKQVRAFLLDVDGLLVDGPSTLGVMQVYVPANSRFADGQAMLSYLQQQPVVQHAALLGQGR
jgi:hypothetical protein